VKKVDWLENAVTSQLDNISELLKAPLQELADCCAPSWHDQRLLDEALVSYLRNKVNHRCRLLYAIDETGKQVSSNISADDTDTSNIGRDLSDRPYLGLVEQMQDNFVLSTVYLDKRRRRPCITALQRVFIEDQMLGYIAADFSLKELPLRDVEFRDIDKWRQIKGDPSIRGTLFQQTRTVSAMDQDIDNVMSVIDTLVCEQGIFHAKLHFSSSRATLWPFNDPYRYRIHVLDEILNPKVCLIYKKMDYPQHAVIPPDRVASVLDVFKALRAADETIYLRAASVNIMNGLVGLNFSCDGSHYMQAEEFLGKDISFWFGSGAVACVP
jgi:hypothetical protein